MPDRQPDQQPLVLQQRMADQVLGAEAEDIADAAEQRRPDQPTRWR